MPSGRSGPQAKGMKRSTLGGQEVTWGWRQIYTDTEDTVTVEH